MSQQFELEAAGFRILLSNKTTLQVEMSVRPSVSNGKGETLISRLLLKVAVKFYR